MKRWISMVLLAVLLVNMAVCTPAEDLLGSINEIIGDAQLAQAYLQDEYIYRQSPEMVGQQKITAIGANAYSVEGLLVLQLPESIAEISPAAFADVNMLILVADDESYAAQFAAENGIMQINPDEWFRLKALRAMLDMSGVPAVTPETTGGVTPSPTPESTPEPVAAASPTPTPEPAREEGPEPAIFPLTIATARQYQGTILAAGNYTAAIGADGGVESTGKREEGRNATDGWQDITALSAGDYHTAGLKADGTVEICGYSYMDLDVSGWSDIEAIVSGDSTTLGLKADGTVEAIGYDDRIFRDVSEWQDITALSMGEAFILGLKEDGAVVASHSNSGNMEGQCDVSDWNNIVAIATGGDFSVGLKADGSVVATGNNEDGQCEVSAWTDIVQINTGIYHTAGLRADGAVEVAGYLYQQDKISEWTDVVSIVSGAHHVVGLKADGTVVAAGDDINGQCDVSDWTDIVAIAAGELHTVGLKADGTVVACGWNGEGECNVSAWTNILIPEIDASVSGFVSAGDSVFPLTILSAKEYGDRLFADSYHMAALQADGTVLAKGWNGVSVKGADEWQDVIAISSGADCTLGLKADGAVLYTGPASYAAVRDWTDMVQVDGGTEHVVGLKADGTVVATGRNGKGQCNVGGWSNIVDIAAGAYHTVGLKTDGTVVFTGETGGDTKPMSEWTDIVDVEAGTWYTVGLKTDGTVVSAGWDYGQKDVGDWTDVVAICCGGSDTLGLRADGAVLADGDDDYDQRTGAARWTDMVAVSSGYKFNIGLKADGTVLQVGKDYNGQCTTDEWKIDLSDIESRMREEVVFADAGFEWMVRRTLGAADDVPITRGDLSAFRAIAIAADHAFALIDWMHNETGLEDGKAIQSLEDLKWFDHLESVSLNMRACGDMPHAEFIATLPESHSIGEFTISGGELDLSSLELQGKLWDIDSLVLNDSALTNLDGIQNCGSFRLLNLRNCTLDEESEAALWDIYLNCNVESMFLDNYTLEAPPVEGVEMQINLEMKIARGDRGEVVQQLQNALKERGYLAGTADGIFGGGTETAVKAAQKDLGMQETGRADARFLYRLFMA